MLWGCGEGTHARTLALLYKLQTEELITEVSRFLLVVHCFHFVLLWNMRDTWSNRQVWPWSTKLSRAKANRVLPRQCTGHSKHPFLTTQRAGSTHGHHQMIITEIRLVIFFAAKDGEVLYSQQKQDWQLTVAQIKSSLLQNSGLN